MTIKGEAGQQLKMFMTAREIRDNYVVRYAESRKFGGDVDAMWAHKLKTSDIPFDRRYRRIERPLSEDLKLHGVEKPVSLAEDERRTVRTPGGDVSRGSIIGGHHRIASMYRDDPDELMPVLHYSDWQQAVGDTRTNQYIRYT